MSELSRKQMRNMQRSRGESVGKSKKGLTFLFFCLAVLTGVAFLILFFINSSKKSAEEEKSLNVQSLADQGQDHIKTTDPYPKYNSNPPTSGPHLGQPYGFGINDKELDDRGAIHNLEHGGIWITYNCQKLKKSGFNLVTDVFAHEDATTTVDPATLVNQPGVKTGSITTDPACQELKSQLEELAKSLDKKVLLTPRVNNVHLISVVAWTKLIELDSFDKTKIEKFYKLYKDKGPEYFPD